jgi:hypothetical protein
MVVTATDSGNLGLTKIQEDAGWVERHGLVYSSLLDSVDAVFYQRDGYDAPGFDEWYFFMSPVDLGAPQEGNPFDRASAPGPGRPMVFVGMPSATLHDTDPRCEVVRQMFWTQLDWIQPESYAADSQECLTFVSRNQNLFELVLSRFREARGV